jgi:hypothetical protein
LPGGDGVDGRYWHVAVMRTPRALLADLSSKTGSSRGPAIAVSLFTLAQLRQSPAPFAAFVVATVLTRQWAFHFAPGQLEGLLSTFCAVAQLVDARVHRPLNFG